VTTTVLVVGGFCSYSDVNVLETFIHLLQLISTSQQGVQALGNQSSIVDIIDSCD